MTRVLNLTPAERLAGEVDSIYERIDELHRREADGERFPAKWDNVGHRLERAMADALYLTRCEADVFDRAHHYLGMALRSLLKGLGGAAEELRGLADAIRQEAPAPEPPGPQGKCSECRTPYSTDFPACPECGTVERVLCQASRFCGCDDLATGVFYERGHTFDGCDDHRDHPYPWEGR